MVACVSADLDDRPAIDRQCHAGDEVRLVRGQEQRRIGDVPRRSHAPAQRHSGVAFGGDFGAAPIRARALVSTAIGVSISPGKMTLARIP